MTTAKIAITLPHEQVARIRRAVRGGRARSVSGYIAQVLAEHERVETLDAVLHDLVAQFGEPTSSEVAWAKRALSHLRRA